MPDVVTSIFAVLGLAVLTFGAFLLLHLTVGVKKRRLAKQIRQAQLAIERMEAADGDISKLPGLKDQVKGLVLSPGEHCFAAHRKVQRVVQRHRNNHFANSHGVSFLIAKGIRYRVASYDWTPVRAGYEKVQDRGSLYVTTHRVVFTGTHEVISIVGKEVADIKIDGDHLWILAENRKAPLGLKVTVPAAHVLAYATRLLAESSQSTMH
jgi:hypothetical protein